MDFPLHKHLSYEHRYVVSLALKTADMCWDNDESHLTLWWRDVYALLAVH